MPHPPGCVNHSLARAFVGSGVRQISHKRTVPRYERASLAMLPFSPAIFPALT